MYAVLRLTPSFQRSSAKLPSPASHARNHRNRSSTTLGKGDTRSYHINRQALPNPRPSTPLIGKPCRLNSAPWERSARSVAIALRSTCKFCASSVPFYRRVSDMNRAKGSSLAIHVVSPEAPSVIGDFLGRGSISADRVFQLRLDSLGIAGAPAILIVDQRGDITGEFVGILDESSQRAVVERLK